MVNVVRDRNDEEKFIYVIDLRVLDERGLVTEPGKDWDGRVVGVAPEARVLLLCGMMRGRRQGSGSVCVRCSGEDTLAPSPRGRAPLTR